MIRFISALRTAMILTALLIGGPILLAVATGPPLPRRPPSIQEVDAWLQRPFDPVYAAGTARVAAWILWALLAAAAGAAVVAQLRRWRWSRLVTYLPRPAQTLIAAVLGTVAVTTSVTSVTGTPTSAAATDDDRFGAEQTRPAMVPAADPTTAPNPNRGRSVSPQARNTPDGVHRVISGDTLWDIARRDLDDPLRWKQIYTLNRGKPQANGHALHDPDQIHVGWLLALPDSQTGSPSPAEPATGPSHREPPTTASPHPETPAHPSPTSTAAPPRTETSHEPAGAGTEPAGGPATARPDSAQGHSDGVTLSSHGWVSLSLAATIAVAAALLRLHRRRFARLHPPIPVGTGPQQAPVPPELAAVDAAGRRTLTPGDPIDDEDGDGGVRPATPTVAAPIGVDSTGTEVSLFDLTRAGLALTGPGADPVARAVLASTLATGVADPPFCRPTVVTSIEPLTRLLPKGAAPAGLDPQHATFDGERLLVLADTDDAVTHAEEEMIERRRLLDTFDAASIAELNARTDHIEFQPPYVVLVDNAPRHAGRLAAIAAHSQALHLHLVVFSDLDGIPNLSVTADGSAHATLLHGNGRLATLTAADLADVLHLIAAAAARPEPGTDIDDPATPGPMRTDDDTPAADLTPDLPTTTTGTAPIIRLSVLGPVTVTTAAGPVTTGMRSGSYAVLALLAAHPHGRTLDQLKTDLHPDTDPDTAAKRVRTDITTARRVLRNTSGEIEPMFIVHDPATGRYRLDPDLIEVDLWRMLTAIGHANTATDDTMALASLREAADLYHGDFAENQDRAWVTDYATTHRHQILGVYARIAELLETDQPDAAVAALERAIRYDPINEELYQRIMRIHGRHHRPDAVRRTLHHLENQLDELGCAEPSEATIRVAARQLRPAPAGARA